MLEERIDATAALLAPYVQQDPTKFCTYEEFQTAAETLKEFCSLRAQSIAGQLAGTIPATSEGQAADSSTPPGWSCPTWELSAAARLKIPARAEMLPVGAGTDRRGAENREAKQVLPLET